MRLFNKIMIGLLASISILGASGIAGSLFFVEQNKKTSGIANWGIYLNENNLKYRLINISSEQQLYELFSEENKVKNFANITGIKSDEIETFEMSEGLTTETKKHSISFEIKLKDGQIFANNASNKIRLSNIPTGISDINLDEANKFYIISEEGELQGLTDVGLIQETLTLPDSVISIAEAPSNTEGIFSKAKNLNEVILSKNLKKINKYAFAGSSFKSIYIPPSVSSFGYGAFENCTNLKDVIIPNDTLLRSTGGAVFRNTAIENITLPKNIAKIDDTAFQNIESLRLVVILNENMEFGGTSKKIFLNSGFDKKTKNPPSLLTKFIVPNDTVKSQLVQQIYHGTSTKIPGENIFTTTPSPAQSFATFLNTKVSLGNKNEENI